MLHLLPALLEHVEDLLLIALIPVQNPINVRKLRRFSFGVKLRQHEPCFFNLSFRLLLCLPSRLLFLCCLLRFHYSWGWCKRCSR
jgi:hypothetical protein